MRTVEIINAEVLPKFEKLEAYHSSLSSDWFGQSLSPPAHYLFGMDCDHLHFFASRNSHAMVHPESRSGEFQAELWKYDVAEFFLRAPDSNHYLEFNLAPNGGWWSCLFKETLVRMEENNPPLPGVIASGEVAPDGWNAHAKIPLSFLREHLDFGSDSMLNATFILNSPEQIFLTAGPPAPGKPNFHRPDDFPGVRIRSDVTL